MPEPTSSATHPAAPPSQATPPAARSADVGRSLPEAAHWVLIRFGSLGDVVKCTALPRLIKSRYPRARLTMVTSEAYLELIRDNPYIDQPIGFERKTGLGGLRALGRQISAQGVDLVVDVHRSLRSRILASRISAPSVAYSKRTLQRFLLINWGVNTYRNPTRKEEDFLAAVAPYGVTDDGRGTELFTHRVAEDPAVRARIGGLLDRLAAWRAEGRPIAGVAPMAAWELKRWPLQHFRDFMSAWVDSAGGRCVVFGGPGDREAEELAAALEPHALSVAGRTGLLESAYVASRLDVMVANDTGMSHIAEAVGTDVIALFGPTSRELGYFPSRPTSRVLELPLPCRPCTRMGEGRCTHPLDRACLTRITPADVLGAVQAHIEGRPSA